MSKPQQENTTGSVGRGLPDIRNVKFLKEVPEGFLGEVRWFSMQGVHAYNLSELSRYESDSTPEEERGLSTRA